MLHRSSDRSDLRTATKEDRKTWKKNRNLKLGRHLKKSDFWRHLVYDQYGKTSSIIHSVTLKIDISVVKVPIYVIFIHGRPYWDVLGYPPPTAQKHTPPLAAEGDENFWQRYTIPSNIVQFCRKI